MLFSCSVWALRKWAFGLFFFVLGGARVCGCVVHVENRLKFREGMEIFGNSKDYFWNCRSKFLAFRLHCNVRIVLAVRLIFTQAIVL